MAEVLRSVSGVYRHLPAIVKNSVDLATNPQRRLVQVLQKSRSATLVVAKVSKQKIGSLENFHRPSLCLAAGRVLRWLVSLYESLGRTALLYEPTLGWRRSENIT